MPSGELAFLAWLRRTGGTAAGLEVPIGDDAAVWRLPSGEALVLAADAIAEGAHFRSGEDPRLVGRKALAVNLSDLAAMGAAPLCALATCALPRGFALPLAEALTEGLRGMGEEFGCPLVGGDTTTHDGGIVLSVSVVGTLPHGAAVLRSGARPGDLVFVSGALGGSIHGPHLRFVPRLRESAALMELGPPTAMMDVSDGLLLDLHRLADASGVGFRIEAERVPVHADALRHERDPLRSALGGGEDFELLFTLPKERAEAVLARWNLATPITEIGEILPDGRLLVQNGHSTVAAPLGFEHV